MSTKKTHEEKLADLFLQHDVASACVIEKVKDFILQYHGNGIRFLRDNVLEIEHALCDYDARTKELERNINVYENVGDSGKCEANVGLGRSIGIRENLFGTPIGVWGNWELGKDLLS